MNSNTQSRCSLCISQDSVFLFWDNQFYCSKCLCKIDPFLEDYIHRHNALEEPVPKGMLSVVPWIAWLAFWCSIHFSWVMLLGLLLETKGKMTLQDVFLILIGSIGLALFGALVYGIPRLMTWERIYGRASADRYVLENGVLQIHIGSNIARIKASHISFKTGNCKSTSKINPLYMRKKAIIITGNDELGEQQTHVCGLNSMYYDLWMASFQLMSMTSPPIGVNPEKDS